MRKQYARQSIDFNPVCAISILIGLFVSWDAFGQWTRVLVDGPWFPSKAEALLSHDEALWRVGNTVWRSEDGHSWEQLQYDSSSSNPPPQGPIRPWSAREAYAATIYENRIWFADGVSIEGAESERDAWSSLGGEVWVEELAQGTAPWGQRSHHSLVAHDDAMFILGGFIGVDDHDDPLIEWYNDVWRTTDGKVWTQVTDDAPWVGRERHAVVSFNGKMWLLGGLKAEAFVGENVKLNDIWSSTDGNDWTREVEFASWARRFGHRCVVFDDAIYLIGGDFEQDMWRSEDGITWSLVGDRMPWGRIDSHAVTVHDNSIWLAVGTRLGIPTSEIWRYDVPEPGPYGRAHSADQNSDNRITLSELLRVIQFFNSGGYHCNPETEDGYQPGLTEDADDCPPHASDYGEQDGNISLSELLRAIQFFNSGSYFLCPNDATEDGFCAGL